MLWFHAGNPYDLGWKENWLAVFGPHPLGNLPESINFMNDFGAGVLFPVIFCAPPSPNLLFQLNKRARELFMFQDANNI
jgi:hypothetical protein